MWLVVLFFPVQDSFSMILDLQRTPFRLQRIRGEKLDSNSVLFYYLILIKKKGESNILGSPIFYCVSILYRVLLVHVMSVMTLLYM